MNTKWLSQNFVFFVQLGTCIELFANFSKMNFSKYENCMIGTFDQLRNVDPINSADQTFEKSGKLLIMFTIVTFNANGS